MINPYNIKPERLICPWRFQNRINQVGGFNRYHKPNFKLVWAQSETTWQGGEWDNEDGYFKGYQEILKGDGLPHWMLMKWADAGKSIEIPHLPPESAEEFYRNNKCEKTGLSLLGEYPYHGSYHIALNLVAKIFDKNTQQLYIEAFPLSSEIIEMMIPIIRASIELDIQTKMKFMKDENEKDELERSKVFEDAYLNVKRKPTLSATSWLEDRQRQIEKLANASFLAMLNRNRTFQRSSQLRNLQN